MFTSRSIIFALLSFLVGVNACVQCPATVKGIQLSATLPDDQVTVCVYNGINGDGSTVLCQYHTKNGKSSDKSQPCPKKATVKKDC
ncbi:uncharacterized protein EDB91DRAFT_1116146 [Suillus paluster]|uniref:uncharacterized protein n=1 Tax=Suillus paluster TaxID=48578 RepID=UPI001B87EF9D|nr:uncharacterized protein EDB91DRAFT_1116146 [Suillus paluster]KAG1747083.1 hypothetical protein EDB91DRAFT_1116146 [Suillus paluster]